MFRPAALIALVASVVVLAAACDDEGPPAEPTSTQHAATATTTPQPTEEPGVTASPTFEGGQEPVEGSLGTSTGVPPVPLLVDVRTGQHEGFDRLVFEFEGAASDYRVEYVRTATDCGTGEPLFNEVVGGGALLQVSFSPAAAHDDAGRPTFGRTELTPPFFRGALLRQTCDFEGVLTWVLLLSRSAPRDFRVLELEDPFRLAVDVQHP